MKNLSSAEIYELFADGIVRHGPFAGMRYPQLLSIGSAIIPKVLGSYEAELHDWIKEICATDYTEVIDIGCAEGFYAVGLARRLPNSIVYAYDTDPKAQELTAAMAAANGVSERVIIRETFAGTDITSIPLRQRGLLVCDCEGNEKYIFTAATVPLFRDWDILIETHDLFDLTISTTLTELFAATHNLRIAVTVDDILKAKYYRYPELQGLNIATRRAMLAEYRPAAMEWFFLTPKTRTVAAS